MGSPATCRVLQARCEADASTSPVEKEEGGEHLRVGLCLPASPSLFATPAAARRVSSSYCSPPPAASSLQLSVPAVGGGEVSAVLPPLYTAAPDLGPGLDGRAEYLGGEPLPFSLATGWPLFAFTVCRAYSV